jgi:hypothetical protein
VQQPLQHLARERGVAEPRLRHGLHHAGLVVFGVERADLRGDVDGATEFVAAQVRESGVAEPIRLGQAGEIRSAVHGEGAFVQGRDAAVDRTLGFPGPDESIEQPGQRRPSRPGGPPSRRAVRIRTPPAAPRGQPGEWRGGPLRPRLVPASQTLVPERPC